ncbi:MAG: NnrS family protein [Chthoniobacterales bacterium]|nr:NnrS family protein [Chthoniobacterales bacterium]
MAMDGRMSMVTKLCEESFRVFFVVGTLLGVIAVSLWPLYYAGWIAFYPGRAHARLMIEGFMAPFIIGFLGTAGPRITSTPHFSASEIFALLTLTLLAAGLHFGGAARAGDVTFVILMLMVASALGKRFRAREDWPPANFALVALGILNALIGATFLAAFENAAYSVPYRVGAMLLEQGFILFPILGVAPFLLPRLLDVPRSDELRKVAPCRPGRCHGQPSLPPSVLRSTARSSWKRAA